MEIMATFRRLVNCDSDFVIMLFVMDEEVADMLMLYVAHEALSVEY